MRIAVVGTGYVGLVAGTCFAESGNDVTCIDNDASKVERLKQGEIPIYEPGLEELVKRNVAEGRLQFDTDLATAVGNCEIAFIAVGTPQSHDGQADLAAVKIVASEIGKAIKGPIVVVIKSTVPVGTAAIVRDIISQETTHEFHIANNPEFLKEGAAIDDFMKPDRVVIGTDSPKVADLLQELYSPFLRTAKPCLVMDNASAEMTKYAANALLATKITFMNEVARLCEKVGADVSLVRNGVGSDSRIGYPFLFPGVGYGGSCFPKDVRAISYLARSNDASMKILDAVDIVNEEQKMLLVHKVVERYGEDLSGHTFAVWGLAFKPKTDDMREAPSIVVINALLDRGAKVKAFDPEARHEARHVFGDRIELPEHPYEVLDGSTALITVTEWNEFRHPDFDRIKKTLKEPVIFDGRNMYSYAALSELGFSYYGIGVRDSSYE
ncbi:MAG: UDP-glucose/GDP-mannose dehydrogenase family protein [Planctomycetota bacterium]